ncbi:hypothetical protein BG006_005505 [Podila minutissima]|uniref:Uncharacterized protein n=1 Tax=Podila minutissima TaxID=64525 RepID=A0A9P5SS67_9FUNG|nr:hypothetical protein BG006_005505 [Podila minutissima]
MKSAAFFAFFLAMFAMFFSSSVAAESSALEKRATKTTQPVGAAFDATVDLLVKEHAEIVVKAFADVCTDADLNSALKTNLRVQISGLINVDFGLGTRLSAALSTSIKAAVKAEVDAEIESEFTANLKVNIGAIIIKQCPKKDAACIKLQAKKIVQEAVKLTTKASVKIAAQITAKIQAKVKAAIDIQVKKFSINLILVKINVTGGVDVSNSIGIKFKAAAGLVVKACADIVAKQASKIRAICSA